MTRRSEGGQKRASYGPPRIRILSTKYHDTETGLIHFTFRDYDPETGRWLNRDPISEKGGLNLYAFCLNNSINLIDPLGMSDMISSYRYFHGQPIETPQLEVQIQLPESVITGLEYFGAGSQLFIGAVLIVLPEGTITKAGGALLIVDSIDKLQSLIRGEKSEYEKWLDNLHLTEDQRRAAYCAKEVSLFVIDVSAGFVKVPRPTGIVDNASSATFKEGANITPRSTALEHRIIGRGGRTFVTEPDAITKIVGDLPPGNRITITNSQARQLENALGLRPNSLESRNILSIIDDVPSRAPASPISGNPLFKGGGAGLPGGGSELTIQGIPSAGGTGVRRTRIDRA